MWLNSHLFPLFSLLIVPINFAYEITIACLLHSNIFVHLDSEFLVGTNLHLYPSYEFKKYLLMSERILSSYYTWRSKREIKRGMRASYTFIWEWCMEYTSFFFYSFSHCTISISLKNWENLNPFMCIFNLEYCIVLIIYLNCNLLFSKWQDRHKIRKNMGTTKVFYEGVKKDKSSSRRRKVLHLLVV